jgi:hypothetical protein
MEQCNTSQERARLHLLEALRQQRAECGTFALSDTRTQQSEERVDRG